MAIDPRIRNSSGQFSAKGTLTARALRQAWRIAPRRALPPPTRAATGFKATLPRIVDFGAVPSSFTADKIDTVNAVIRGVSVITSGLIARGHDLEVDGVTLDQMQKCAESKGQVPVKVDHKSGAAAVCGFLTNFRQEEGKLKADWFLLETHPQKAQILEVARRMPQGVGLSASFLSPDKPERAKSGRAAARCHDLISVDYVTLPAANPNGMFAAKVDSSSTAMTPDELNAAIAAALAPLTQKVDALQKAHDLAQNPPTLDEVAGMDEAQLAELGLTKQDVLEALEAAAQAEADGEQGLDADGQPVAGEGEGELATAGASAEGSAAAPAAAGAATGLDAIMKVVTELSAQVAALKGEKVVDAETKLVNDLEKHFETLTAENERLRKAVEIGSSVGAVSPGVESNGLRFFSEGSDKGEFERLVNLEVGKGVPKAKAFTTVINTHPAAYKEFRVRSGIEK